MVSEHLMLLNFKCNKCGCTLLEEVRCNVIETWAVESVQVDGEEQDIDFGGRTNSDYGDLSAIKCESCGFIIGESWEEAIAWLQWHQAYSKGNTDE